MAMSRRVVARLRVLAATAELEAADLQDRRLSATSTGSQIAARNRSESAAQLAAEWSSLLAYAQNPNTCPPKATKR